MCLPLSKKVNVLKKLQPKLLAKRKKNILTHTGVQNTEFCILSTHIFTIKWRGNCKAIWKCIPSNTMEKVTNVVKLDTVTI